MEGHGLVRLNMAQHALYVQTNLAMLGCGFEQRTVKIPVNQPCKWYTAVWTSGSSSNRKGSHTPSEVHWRFSLSAVKY